MQVFQVTPNLELWRKDIHPQVNGTRQWKMPSIKCSVCGVVWGTGTVAYPMIDLAELKNNKSFKASEIFVVDKIKYEEIVKEIIKLCGVSLPLFPGCNLGKFRGKHSSGVLEDFYLFYDRHFVSLSAYNRLTEAGAITVGATPIQLFSNRKKEPLDYVELHLVPRARLAASKTHKEKQKYCPECGFDQRSLPDPLAVYANSIPLNEEIFQLIDDPGVILATEKFVKGVKLCGLSGIEFERVEVVDCFLGNEPEVTEGGFRTSNLWMGNEFQNSMMQKNAIKIPVTPKSVAELSKTVLDAAFVKQWKKKLHEFLKFIKGNGGDSSCGSRELNYLQMEGLEIPSSLRVFIINYGSIIDFQYNVIIDGDEVTGTLLIDSREFFNFLVDCKSWADETWIAEEPEEKELWLNAFPFAHLANGDYLGLADWEKHDDPPVVYLSHDDSSQIIAPNLGAFLDEWAGVCFVGPEFWMLEPFLDKTTGYLNSNTDEARKFRTKMSAKIGSP